MKFLPIIISAIFVNNIVLTQFLGTYSLVQENIQQKTAMRIGVSVVILLTLATIVNYLFKQYVLSPLHIGYLQTVTYMLIITIMASSAEILLKKVTPALHRVFGIYLSLATLNCAVLGVSLLVTGKDFNLLESVVYASATGVGFTLVLVIITGIREQLAWSDVPKGMAGIPVALITAGILALAFMGFAGLV